MSQVTRTNRHKLKHEFVFCDISFRTSMTIMTTQNKICQKGILFSQSFWWPNQNNSYFQCTTKNTLVWITHPQRTEEIFEWYKQRGILAPNQNRRLQKRPILLVRFGSDQPIKFSDSAFFKYLGYVLWGSVIHIINFIFLLSDQIKISNLIQEKSYSRIRQ